MTMPSASADTNSGVDRKGERGAIMVMGVFLACSLIAGMWYVMGIGDAIIWRDRSQEAADAVAYTSAAVHARGMNFISAINIIMLIIVSLYLLMCIIRTILDMILYITGDPARATCDFPVPLGTKDTEGHNAVSGLVGIISSFTGTPYRYTGIIKAASFPLDFVDNSATRDLLLNAECTIAVWICCMGNHPLEEVADIIGPAYVWVEKAIIYYEKFMKIVLPPMHSTEVIVAKTFPWVGAATSLVTGAKYQERLDGNDPNNVAHRWGIAMSPSLFTNLKTPTKEKRLKPDCKDDNNGGNCLNYIKFEGNGCGTTMCNDNQVSRSGPYLQGTKAPNATCCEAGSSGCTSSGVCSSHGGIKGNQDDLYYEVTIDSKKDYRIGLPVEAENMNELCKKAVTFLGDFINGLLQQIPGVGWLMNFKVPGVNKTLSDLLTSLFEGLGSWIKKAYCTYDPAFGAAHSKSGYEDVFPKGNGPDDANEFWAIDPDSDHTDLFVTHKGGNGPMKVVPYASNGGDYFQVYGIVANTHFNPLQGEYGNKASGNSIGAWSKIRLAVGPKEWSKSDYDDKGVLYSGNGPWFYLAEAEFYHDCDTTWSDNACNGDDHATYRLNWRTRLRRVHKPIYITDLTGKIPGGVTNILGKIVTNQWAINKFTTQMMGMDLGAVFNDVELLFNLAGSNKVMPTIYH